MTSLEYKFQNKFKITPTQIEKFKSFLKELEKNLQVQCRRDHDITQQIDSKQRLASMKKSMRWSVE